MKDPTQSIIDALYTLFNGNITYNSKSVKVFKDQPTNSKAGIVKGKLYHYILLENVDDTELGANADNHVHDATVDIEVVVGFPGIGSKAVVNSITDDAMRLLPAKGAGLSLGADFSNIIFELENTVNLEERGTHKVVRKIITFRLEIDET